MATELKTTVIESSDGSKFNIKDATTGWGDDYDKANITHAVINISGPQLSADIDKTLTSGEITSLLSDDGLNITAEELGIGEYFSDGYYEIRLTLTILVGSPFTDYYINKKGFIEQHRNRVFDMTETIQYPLDNYESELDKIIAALLLESAEAAADRGSYTRFQYIIDKINVIFENYNLESL